MPLVLAHHKEGQCWFKQAWLKWNPDGDSSKPDPKQRTLDEFTSKPGESQEGQGQKRQRTVAAVLAEEHHFICALLAGEIDVAEEELECGLCGSVTEDAAESLEEQRE